MSTLTLTLSGPMSALTLTDDQEFLWTIALVIGGVVALVVIVLMTMLLLLLRDLAKGARSLRMVADALDGDGGPRDISATAATVHALRDELRRHEKALSRP